MLENTVPPSPSPSPSPSSIRRWLRGSPLGAGSFGKVSLALNPDDGFVFAVKSTPCSSPPQLLSLQNELHILHSLNSPRIIRCLGADVAPCDNSPCLNVFLEYMPEGSVADLLKTSGGRLDEARARVYTRAILEGLCYLHRQGIVHSDIKGQNILLGTCGEIKIADFGAAKRIESTSETSQSHNDIRGTPLWMAPEVLQGVEQGTPSDIWSLGCTLVEMLQGRPPWGSLKEHTSTNDLASLLFKIAFTHESPPLVDSLLSAEAKDFLNKCLQRDPRERWTAEQLLKHPFVMIKEQGIWNYAGQASPRSTLDFYDESGGESEPESPRGCHDACISCTHATEAHSDGRQQRRLVLYENMVEDYSPLWITVRSTEGWSKERQRPFFRAAEVIVRKASEVSFDSLGSLANRAGAVVG